MLPQLNIPLPPARSLKSPRAVAAHTNKNKLSPSHPCKGAIFPKLGARAVVINPAQPSLPSYPHPARCSARGWRVGCCSCTALSGLLKYLMVPKYDLIDDIIFILRTGSFTNSFRLLFEQRIRIISHLTDNLFSCTHLSEVDIEVSYIVQSNQSNTVQSSLSRLLLLLLLITLHRLHCSLLASAPCLISVILGLTPVAGDSGDHV